MARFISPVNSFKSGVLSKRLYSRTDISEYDSGLSLGKNAFVGKHGGAYKRNGIRNIQQLAGVVYQIESVNIDIVTSVYIVFRGQDFIFLDEYGERFSIEYAGVNTSAVGGRYQVTAFKDQIVITHNSGTLDPYYFKIKQDDVSNLPYVDSYDRLSDSEGNPRHPQSSPNIDGSKKIQLTTTGLNGVITANSIGFNIDDELIVGDILTITGISYVNSVSKLTTNIYQVQGFPSPTSAQLSGYTYTSYNGNVYDNMFNLSVVGWTGDTLNVSYDSNTSEEFTEWSYSQWGDVRGWPRTVAVDEGRLIFGGNKEAPSNIWGSKVGNPKFFFDRTFPEAKADVVFTAGGNVTTVAMKWDFPYESDISTLTPYNFTLATKRESEIRFMESSVNFVVGTSRQEFVISGNGATISQKNITVRPHTSHGSSGPSVVYDNTVLFATRSRQQIQMFKYSEENGSYIAKEISILNPDLLEDDKIKSMDWHEELGIAFIVTDGGSLITLTVNNETGTIAFTVHEFDGFIQDATYGIDDEGDYISIVRVINSKTFLDRISRQEISFPMTYALEEYSQNVSYLDDMRYLAANEIIDSINTSPIRMFTSNGSLFEFNKSRIMVGDQIVFSNIGGDPLNGTNIGYGIPYYVIPDQFLGGEIGFRIAASVADAMNGIHITVTGMPLVAIFAQGLGYTLTRFNALIPINSFSEGDLIQLALDKDDSNLGDPLELREYLVTATDIANQYIDLGGPFKGVAYGKAYKFHIATMPIEAGQQWGSAMMGMKRVDTAMVRLYKTKSYKISTDGYNSEDRVFDDYESKRDDVKIQGSPERDHIVHIQNDKPEAIYVASVAFRGVSNDG